MKTIVTHGGDFLYDVLARAVDEAPAEFEFNGMKFQTRTGEPLRAARERFLQEHGIRVLTHKEAAAESAANLGRTITEHAEAIQQAGVATEAEMRDAKVPHIESSDELLAYITSLVDRPHDYGTCVYAMSMAATAAFNYVAHKLGVTGFQASCADMDILRRTRNLEWGRVLNYEKLLYPQYCNDETFPSAASLLADRENWPRLRDKATQNLANPANEGAHPDVLAHWRKLATLG